MPVVNLPTRGGRTEAYRLKGPQDWNGHGRPNGGNAAGQPKFDRIALAAAHVVADPLADTDPWLKAAIDWDATIAYRRHLWSLGLGVAEAMDTAQRGGGLDWPNAIGAHPPLGRGGARHSRRRGVLRHRHRPARAVAVGRHRRRHPRL